MENRKFKAAREHSVFLAVGVTERDPVSKTLYCTLLYFGPDGQLLGRHRKIKPTAAERLLWGEGDGSTLCTFDTEVGRLGGLICWENYMPLARMAMYSKGVEVYLAPTADIDLDEIVRSRMDFSVTGHYSRDDIFEYRVRGQPAMKTP